MTHKPIAEFVSHLRSLDVQLSLENDRLQLRCSAPTGVLTHALRQELADRKAELVAYLNSLRLPLSPSTATLQPLTQGTVFPLSFAQQRLWFLYQLAPDNPFYNVPAALRLKGTVDQIALERSLQEIVRRHAALRTTFTLQNGQPMQRVEPDSRVQLSVINLQMMESSKREAIAQQLATAEAQRPFNLTTDPLLRVTLLHLAPQESLLLLTLHHIVADGWSLGVLVRELAHYYPPSPAALPPLPIQYPDFACWQRNWLQGDVLDTQLTYWRNQLQDLPELNLPSDRPRPAVQTFKGATCPLHIPPALTEALTTLSQQSGVSLFMTLLAALQTLLYRYTGQEDIAIGSPIANRHRSELEGLIGFFVNSLVLRIDLSGNPTFRELLQRVREVALDAYKYQDLPFEKLVEALDPDRDLSRNPLFQVAFALQNAPLQPLELPGLTLEPAPLESGSTRFDLEVHLWEPTHGLRSIWQSQTGLSGFISYSIDLFDRDRIIRLIGHFQTLLTGIVANPDARLSDLPLLTAAEYQQIVVEWNQTAQLLQQDINCSQPEYFHHIFERQAQATPDAIALVSEQGMLTYQELNEQADHLAQILRQLGVQASLVGLCVERSAVMVIGILGILKAGGAYVPLDPNYPRDRLHFIVTDTQVSVLLTQSWLIEKLPRSQAQVICLDQLYLNQHYLDEPTDQSIFSIPTHGEDQTNLSTTDQLAYVIYTSGSTGTPKGVLLSQKGLCNVVAAQQQTFYLSATSRVLQFSSLSFDASIFEIALAFGCGGTLYIPPASTQLPGMALIQFLQENAITHVLLTPSVLAVLPAADLPALQVLITGGEACPSQVVDRWATGRHFFNAYGPTETTIWATVAELHPGDHPLIIGRPILNTQVYILDANQNPVPAGIPGELYISGTGLACGYLNRPALTAERFISFKPNHLSPRLQPPFCPLPAKLYKTGDRALYHRDGRIEFLGRIDHQVKIRGFRVELGEIEATLQQHPAIREAAVVVDGETTGETRLIAYFSLDRQHLQQTVLQSLQAQHVQNWQTLYNQTYQTGTPNPKFNIIGWNSSYTGEPLPQEAMQEWVSDRVQQILALKPRRVLEIGCGTGLLLFQIAPHCQKYVGTDFSPVALATIQQQLEALNLSHVELLQRTANDFTEIELRSFDVVILNSIVQYFPSQDYLMQVLQNALQVLAEPGVLFIGDVRSLPLLNAFHSWVQFNQADSSMERTQLQQRVVRSQFEEPELAIDPAFFDALRGSFPSIQRVQIRLSRGHHQNEMTQFRYNVLCWCSSTQPTIGARHSAVTSQLFEKPSDRMPRPHKECQLEDSKMFSNIIQYYNWQHHPITIDEIKKYLSETKPERIIITTNTNQRVTAAIAVTNWLHNQDTPKTVGQMRDRLQDLTQPAIEPQDWWDLETLFPYDVEITWSQQTNRGDYDVQLTRRDADLEPTSFPHLPTSATTYTQMIKSHPTPDEPPPNPQFWGSQTTLQSPPKLGDLGGNKDSNEVKSSAIASYTNEPLQANVARQLIPKLRQSLKQTLPDYMLPSVFVPLAALPLTISGKLDRRALPTPSEGISEAIAHPSTSTDTPLTSTELILIDIWKELLQLKQVNLNDNFFELGGHSLLATQMTSRIRDALEVELPLKSIFEAPTIAQLAPILETLSDTHSRSAIPPLVRLDRSAYRHKRSTLLGTATTDSSATVATTVQNSQAPVTSAPSNATRSPLVPLMLGNNHPPFFCVHPLFGVVFPYLELAHLLQSHRSFYGLQPAALDGTSPILNRMDAIAAGYIRAIQTLQPQGPYFLGGWSFGGLVAFEMAQQLTQAGHQVRLLALLDTPAPCHKPSFWQSLKFLLGTALWSMLPFLLDYSALVANRLRVENSWLFRWQWSAIAHLIPPESRLQVTDESALSPMLRLVYAHAQATYHYLPKPYSHQITLFKATEQAEAIGQDMTLGWSTLAQDIQLHQVSGNHLSLLRQPHVQSLAQQLRPYLS
jgi:amino acid adenylation domain-containing protein